MSGDSSGRRRRLRNTAIAVVSVAIVAGAVTGVIAISHRPAAASTTSDPSSGLGTATVVRTDLTNVDQESGTLGYSGSYTISAGTPGTLTALPAAGTVVKRGAVLCEVDGVPEYLFYGGRPEWRMLQSGVSPGPDVYQLDQNLIALGYGGGMRPSNTFSSHDTAAIERWQKAKGLTVTGVLQLGSVIYMSGPVRVATHHTEPGANVGPGAPLADATDPTRVVSVALDTAKESEVKVGDTVSLQLPSGAETPGTVTAIADTITPGQQGSDSTVAVTIVVPDQSALGTLDGAPVTVNITTLSAKNVLAVPITALVVETDGSYAVDVLSDGTTHRVKVTTGLFTDTLVQVGGDLHEGDTVVVAST
jgi:peptidoglycan hydrolase-like protein with peptidoglycan-binding domain